MMWLGVAIIGLCVLNLLVTWAFNAAGRRRHRKRTQGLERLSAQLKACADDSPLNAAAERLYVRIESDRLLTEVWPKERP